jgi:hypothetical protein
MRPTRALRWSALGGPLLCMLMAVQVRAQDTIPPVRPDTVAVDTVIVRPDAIPIREAAPDTVRPVRVLPEFRGSDAQGWAAGVWVWDQQALQLQPFFTLGDLIERIPGMTVLRVGLTGQPEAVGGWGWGGGYVEVILDGFALDPIGGAVLDLSRLELVSLRRVRVERRPDRIRIEVETLVADDARTYSRVEAATGDFRTEMLRGLLVTPRFLVGPFAGGVERLSSDGLGRRERATTLGAWGKWGVVGRFGGLQAEMRTHEIERGGDSPFLGRGRRSDAVVRGRIRPFAPVVLEAFAGWTRIDDEFARTVDGEVVEASARQRQIGARMEWTTDPLWIRTTVRSRPGPPGTELQVAGGLRPGRALRLEGELDRADGDGTGRAGHAARIVLEPFAGLRAFAETAAGGPRVNVPAPLDGETGDAFAPRRRGQRLGIQAGSARLMLGVAGIRLVADSVPTYALHFDRPHRHFPGGEATALEVTGRVPLFLAGLALEGDYTYWRGDAWIYRPVETGRIRLVYHDLPLASGNLEVLARVEGVFRGPSYAVWLGDLATIDGLWRLDSYLQLRVLDVRVFLLWENMTIRPGLRDFPGRDMPRQRALYGVRWQFWN